MINTYEPPLVKSVLLERSLRSVVVGIILGIDVHSPHRFGIEGLRRDE